MVVVAVVGVIAAIGIPMTGVSMKSYRIVGDTRSLSNLVTLAKMRAASTFNHVRVYVDLNARTFRLETWQATGTPGWVLEQGPTSLSQDVAFSFAALAAAPPNTQGTIAQAPQCLAADGTAIANTACVVFNSRGIPVDATMAPTGIDAFYLNNGMLVQSVTISAGGLVRTWQSPVSNASWTKQ